MSSAAVPVPAVRADSRKLEVLRCVCGNPGARIGLLLLLGLVVLAAAAPLIAPYDPTNPDYQAVLESPSVQHVFGTDQLGRDVFSRVVYGTRISLRVGSIPVAAAFAIGTLIGILSGFYGGKVDAAIMRLTDIGLAFPGILLALVVVAVLLLVADLLLVGGAMTMAGMSAMGTRTVHPLAAAVVIVVILGLALFLSGLI